MIDRVGGGRCASCLDRIGERLVESASRPDSEGPVPPPSEPEEATREQYRGYHSLNSGDARKAMLSEWERKYAYEPGPSKRTVSISILLNTGVGINP